MTSRAGIGKTRLAGALSLLFAALGYSGMVAANEPAPQAAQTAHEFCPRPAPGSPAPEPEDLRSENGILKVELAVRNERQADGSTRYCYVLGDGNQSPTLRLKPGELLILSLRNRLSDTSSADTHAHANHAVPGDKHDRTPDPCTSGVMTLTSTNLHFHGLTLPPVCHEDEVFKTSIQPTDPPFEYRFRIPTDEPPGLYW